MHFSLFKNQAKWSEQEILRPQHHVFKTTMDNMNNRKRQPWENVYYSDFHTLPVAVPPLSLPHRNMHAQTQANKMKCLERLLYCRPICYDLQSTIIAS